MIIQLRTETVSPKEPPRAVALYPPARGSDPNTTITSVRLVRVSYEDLRSYLRADRQHWSP